MTERYSSSTMGCLIQCESQDVERWAFFAMERDDDVPAYYALPDSEQ